MININDMDERKILIWGTGNIAKELLENGITGEIVGFIETNGQKTMHAGLPVYTVANLPNDYDYILVATVYVNQIYETCVKEQIDLERVIFLFPVKSMLGCTDTKCISTILGEKNYTNYCARAEVYTDTFFEQDLKRYRELNQRDSFTAKEENFWPIIKDKYRKAGTIHNYFWQDLWAARLIYQTGVKKHFDIGSRIDGFIAHLLAMDIEVTLIDIRKFPGEVEKLNTIVDDATLLKQIPKESIESMSALCSLEHFGLGRYGDPIDPEACFKCFKEIQARMKKGGNLYISLPIGRERVEFNAHRIFYPTTVIRCFDQMELVEFSCTSEGTIEYDVNIDKYDNDMHNGEFRYGLFHFMKS